jgi:hypothetical protein
MIINKSQLKLVDCSFRTLDVNECDRNHGCHSNARCVNKPGGYKCECLPGFKGDGEDCTGKFLKM